MMISRMALCVNRVFEIFLDTPFGHALSGVRVQTVQRGRLTGLRPEGCGRLTAAGCVEGLWKKVLRIDGPFRAQGFLSLTALRAEGCGLPFGQCL